MQGLWIGARTKHFAGTDGQCIWCGQADESADHMLWLCPRFQTLRDQLGFDTEAQAALPPLLRFAGLVPQLELSLAGAH
eukprot:3604758-Alexandrium_andersonii.AAC.1